MASRGREFGSRALRAQRARQMAGLPTSGFFGDIFGGALKIGAGLIPGGGIVRDIGSSLIGKIIGSGQKEGARADCPPGFRVDPNTGRCLAEGFGGAVQRFLPGGETGFLPSGPAGPGTGLALMGAFGVPAIQPTAVQAQRLDCPAGFLLGMDNLCYAKGTLPRQFRKWKPSRKPPISAKDWRSLQVSERVSKKVKRIASTAGFTCKRR